MPHARKPIAMNTLPRFRAGLCVPPIAVGSIPAAKVLSRMHTLSWILSEENYSSATTSLNLL
jgi:hypothetical protein